MLLQYWPKSTNVPFMSYRLPALLFSAILIAASFALIFTKGLNFGIDFAGGYSQEVMCYPACYRNEASMPDYRLCCGERVACCFDRGLGPCCRLLDWIPPPFSST